MGFTIWMRARSSCIVNLLVDIAHALIDPRERSDMTAAARRACCAGSRATARRCSGSLLIVAAGRWRRCLAPVLATHPDDVCDFHPAERLQRARARVTGSAPTGWAPTSTAACCSAPASRSSSPSIAVGASLLVGVPIGLVAGYYDGWLSDLLMRVSDIFLAVPQIVLAIAIAQTLGPSIAQRHPGAVGHLLAVLVRALVYAETRALQNEIFIESGDRARRLAAGA